MANVNRAHAHQSGSQPKPHGEKEEKDRKKGKTENDEPGCVIFKNAGITGRGTDWLNTATVGELTGCAAGDCGLARFVVTRSLRFRRGEFRILDGGGFGDGISVVVVLVPSPPLLLARSTDVSMAGGFGFRRSRGSLSMICFFSPFPLLLSFLLFFLSWVFNVPPPLLAAVNRSLFPPSKKANQIRMEIANTAKQGERKRKREKENKKRRQGPQSRPLFPAEGGGCWPSRLRNTGRLQ